MRPSYRAFISYSHQDEAFARWLHRRLESWPVPRELVGRETAAGTIPASLRPIFRDRDDFSSASSLAAATLAALEASEALVVVCSPAAARSRYVDEEIRQFKRLGRSARIFAIIVSGEPGDPDGDCFPSWLRLEPGAEGEAPRPAPDPIAADAREAGDGRQRAAAKIAAGLLGLPFDEIVRREARLRRARLAVLAGVGAGAFLFATALSSYALWQSHRTTIAIGRSLAAVGGMIEMTEGLSPDDPARADMLAAQCDLAAQLSRDDPDAVPLRQQATCHVRRIEARLDTRPFAETLSDLCRWRDGLAERVSLEAEPTSDEAAALGLAIVTTYGWLSSDPEAAALSACEAPNLRDPAARGRQAFEALSAIAAKRPDNGELRGEHEALTWELVKQREASGDWRTAGEIMRQAATLRLAQSENALANGSVHPALIQRAVFLRRLAWLGLEHLGDPAAARADAEAASTLWEEIARLAPDDVEGRDDEVAQVRLLLGDARAANGDREGALAAYREGRQGLQAVLASGRRSDEKAMRRLMALLADREAGTGTGEPGR